MAISILLVDDDEHFRTMLSEALSGDGYQVQEAANGREGIRLFVSNPTDLVITDLVMPEKEGLEMIVEIKRLSPGIKIIAISGGGRVGPRDYLKIAKVLGAHRVLAKPFAHQEILDAISQLLELE